MKIKPDNQNFSTVNAIFMTDLKTWYRDCHVIAPRIVISGT